MKTRNIVSPAWTTSSIGGATDTSPMELSALGDHLNLCQRSGGRLFALQCMAEATNGFVSARFVTTLVVVTMLIGIGSLVL